VIQLKRAYEAVSPDDGDRYLVERLWPRGVKKEALQIQGWLKEIAPSAELRRWYGHDPTKWEEFQHRYRAELDANPDGWQPLLNAVQSGKVTLVYGARDTERNSAALLKAYLEARL
jgi:uncharacterized protein YeaO (DUF488 family)